LAFFHAQLAAKSTPMMRTRTTIKQPIHGPLLNEVLWKPLFGSAGTSGGMLFMAKL
jgi:hypothetical protein